MKSSCVAVILSSLNYSYFSLHAKQPTAEGKVQLAKDSHVSHVMLPKGKLAVFVIPATEKDKLRRRILWY